MLSVSERTFRSRNAGPKAKLPGLRPTCLKSWDKERMQLAHTAVMKENMSIRCAAAAYCVPKSTLADRVSERIQAGAHSGPERYLDDEEEAQLVHFALGAAQMGYAKTKKEIMLIVEALLEIKGKSVQISNGWWEAFRRRHPSITLRSAEKLSYARFVATDQELLNSYYDLLYTTMEEYYLFDCPSQIWNADETGMPFDHKPEKVVAEKGQKVSNLI